MNALLQLYRSTLCELWVSLNPCGALETRLHHPLVGEPFQFDVPPSSPLSLLR